METALDGRLDRSQPALPLAWHINLVLNLREASDAVPEFARHGIIYLAMRRREI